MFKTKRKRAVVLALIAFFCTAATTYVAVDWKRFGGGFLAFFKGAKGDPVVAASGSSGPKGARMGEGVNHSSHSSALPTLVAAHSRKHTSGVTGGANGQKSDEDLFKYGDPAAGGIPPGSFIVAQNDTPAGGNAGGGGLPAPGGAPESVGSPAGGGGEGGVGSPAPAPGGSSDIGQSGTKTPTPAPPPAGSPPAASPPADTPPAPPPVDTPAPAPNQSGTVDDPGTPPPPPSTSLPPVSAVPEASNLAMMSLGALFLAVAASRRRKQQG
jgi:hypothetical protein